MEAKKCLSCKLMKELSYFHKWKYSSDGYRNVCKECRKLETKTYYENNSEIIKKNVSNYRKNNPDKVKEIKKKIYERDKNRILMINKIYRDNNKEKRNEYQRNRKLNDPIYKLKHIMNSRIRVFIKSRNIKKGNKTFEIVGCTPLQLKQYLEERFIDGMSWENQGFWHIDHIVPLSSAKSEEEVFKLCHYSNLQPLWAYDNMVKGNKNPTV